MKPYEIERIAIRVESVRQAENFYTRLFGLDVLGRDADPTNLTAEPGDTDTPEWCMLGRDDFRLALQHGFPDLDARGRLDRIALRAEDDELVRLREQVDELGCVVHRTAEDGLVFEDAYAICWEVTRRPEAEPRRRTG